MGSACTPGRQITVKSAGIPSSSSISSIKSCLINKPIKDADVLGRVLIVMIKRDGEVLVPNGNTVILEDDILVVTSNNVKELEKLLNE